MLGHYNQLLEMMGGLSQPTACANTQALPIDSANCRDSIRDDPKMILGSYVKRAQTISFVERGFERLGLGHQTVVWVAPVNKSRPRSFRSFVLLLSSFILGLHGLGDGLSPFFWRISLYVI